MNSIVEQLEARNETIESLELAVADRRADFLALQDSHREYWAIYSMGYVLEMLLKTAFFRLAGLTIHQDVGWYLKNSRKWSATIGARTGFRNLHDLVAWTHLIVEERSFQGRPVDGFFCCELTARVQIVANHWREDMRYYPSMNAVVHSESVAASVFWVTSNHWRLWS